MKLQNRLADETSPYLRQHRDNPVHWLPWNEESLRIARRLDRPILLSIGYAACHWCHVMAHESFEDNEVAALMNEYFVNIKVDREERPDIDRIYMAALTATGEQGGWPLTMFLTPDARPIWGGTYFPKHPGHGRAGFLEVLRSVHQAWQESRKELSEGAAALAAHVGRQLAAERRPAPAEPALPQLAGKILSLVDPENGGLGKAPKFPNAPMMTALWLGALTTRDAFMAASVVDTHRKMLAGGIYDHVGGGLCRYATDPRWLVPHFEKMLYDTAQLVQLLTYMSATGVDQEFRFRIEQSIDWMQQEMRTDTGAFAASQDADSEGGEGAFYLWDRNEIESVLGDRTDVFLHFFRLVRPQGWQGKPILVQAQPGAPDGQIREDLSRLLANRALRPAPARDDKVLVDWNGLAIRALADASRRFGMDSWHRLALDAFAAIAGLADDRGRLPHSALGATRRYPALSSDYAAMINAAISLWQVRQDAALLQQAQNWAELLRQEHGDGEHGHYLTAASAGDVPMRQRGDLDDAMPSPTAQIIEALARLAAVTSDAELQQHAHACAIAAVERTHGMIDGHVGIHVATSLAASPRKLVLVDQPGKEVFAEVAARLPDPRRVDLQLEVGADPVPLPVIPDTSRPAAWLCDGPVCLPPIHSPGELEKRLSPFAGA